MIPTESTSTWREVLGRAADAVGSRQARWIVERATGWEGAELIAHLGDVGTSRGVAFADALVARRVGGEPLQ